MKYMLEKKTLQLKKCRKKIILSYLRTLSGLNRTLSAIRFEKFDVNAVDVNVIPNSLQNAFRVCKKCSPILRPRYFDETTKPTEPKYLSTL